VPKRSFARSKYKFDNTMSRGLVPLIALLSTATFIFIVIVSLVVAIFELNPEGEKLSFGEVVWASLLRTLDPGTMGQDTGIGFRAAMLAVTLFGIILVAALIGIISNALNSRLEKLSKGKSKVIEKNHTVILGWNSKGVQLVKEILLSNGPHLKSAIVILANKDKVQLEDEILRRVGSLGKTRIVVRSGRPMSRTDLSIVSLDSAKSIIMLSPDFTEDADTYSIKTCLAIKSVDNPPSSSTSIVGEIRDSSNLEAAELVSEGAVHWVLVEQIVNRLIVQTCRQNGLSSVFTELLDFSGSEIYLSKHGKLKGLTYGEVSQMLEASVAVGVIREHDVVLNPRNDMVLSDSDTLIVVAEDGDHLQIDDKGHIEEDFIVGNVPESNSAASTVILGSNSGINVLIAELDKDSTYGSQIVVVTQNIGAMNLETENIQLTIVEQDPTKRKVLEAVDVASFDHIIIVANRDLNDVQHADAKTLHTLLLVRSLTSSNNHINIVSEILDDHNRKLAETSRADDFIVSDKIVSHVIAQIAVNKHLSPVFNTLFAAGGKRISMVPVENYVRTGVPVTFDTVVASALRAGKSAIGYRLETLKNEPGSMHGVRLNPDRKATVEFSKGDTLVVLGK
jgi:voltage-gated potassium channel Kch